MCDSRARKFETLLESIRVRQLAREQVETYEHQGAAAEKLRVLNEKQALANKQTELSNSQVQIRINENAGRSCGLCVFSSEAGYS